MKKYPLLLRPVSKEIIWGGDRLRREYNKTAPFEKIAESWELTVREKEMCVIAAGEYAGVPLGDYIDSARRSVLGYCGARYDRFPLLIKFIDAADRLSIQVHPDNEYGLSHEGELGKTEMWYIMAAEEGAQLVYGLKEGCTVADFAKAVEEGRTEEELNFIDVHPGEVYFIPSGQVHAIGAGILIAEIQQNSNITYRVYDYNRPGADGKPRELHTAKAIDVIKLRTKEEIDEIRFSTPCRFRESDTCEILASCEYFTVVRVKTAPGVTALYDSCDRSFASLLVLDAGSDAELEYGGEVHPIHKGESYFIPAGTGEICISGTAVCILSEVN
ncbi:MAG: class I mannose-6-phosphate isomerase [Clostridia bacterium]|nr:class I mannose-6-phosphate isomerase [Clostridia bacterium]